MRIAVIAALLLIGLYSCAWAQQPQTMLVATVGIGVIVFH